MHVSLIWFLFWAAIVASLTAIGIARRKYHEYRSANWPRAQATVDSVSFHQLERRHGPKHLLVIIYRFNVDGETYFGRYEAELNTRILAEATSVSLRETAFPVRYSAVDPRDNSFHPYRDGPL